jgi:hypothetical protein
MGTDRVTIERETNLRVYPRAPRVRASFPPKDEHVARFGSRMATMLLILELGARSPLEAYDADWFQGEYLYRLRQRLLAFDWFHPDSFDWHCQQFQYESIDLDALIAIGKREYRKLLLEVLHTLYDEEGLGSEITESVRRAFRLPRF